jgi:hypothetical protein
MVEHPLAALPTAGDLFIYAKDLFAEATVAKQPVRSITYITEAAGYSRRSSVRERCNNDQETRLS